MGSLEVQTLEPASYYRFRDELDEAGFATSDGGRTWTGPIAEPFRAFTDGEQMTVHIRDGWPYRHPELEVPGMEPLAHVNAWDYVCLWAQGDASQAWRTLAGWQARIEEWCKKQATEFSNEDATMDAHAYFGTEPFYALATLDLGTLNPKLKDGDSGEAFGRWRRHEALLEITTERTSGGKVRGTWFYRERIKAPPTNLDRLGALLTMSQAARLEKLTAGVARDKKKQRRFIVLAWGRGKGRNALVVLFDQVAGSQARGRVLEFAPSDTETLRLRAGERASALNERRALVFGAGSVGSHVALLLSESGLGSLTVVDGERLRPGNVVRHAAPASLVGAPKVEAVASVIDGHAPWTAVEQRKESPWNPERLRQLIQGQDLVVDATGNASFAEQLSVLTAIEGAILVTASLYRRGYLARVQRQGPGDTLLVERDDPDKYPTIPRGPVEELQQEPGCSAPVNQASPRAVVACASLAAELVVDTLGARSLPDEITEIYHPLEEAPFDRIGRLASG